MEEAEIIATIDSVFAETLPNGIKDMGKVMKILNEKLASQNADMSLVSKIVKEKLNNM